MTLVSVIIPAYNASAWIRQSVVSVLDQTHGDLEVIVVDDGSADATAEVAAGIRDSRVRLVRQENRGQSAALNRGFAASSGSFIKILDADDWLNKEHIAAQLAAVDGAPRALGSCRWGYFVGEPTTARPRPQRINRDYADPKDWLVDALTFDEGMMPGWMWLIPRILWVQSGGWDERLTLNNDFAFSTRLLMGASEVRFAPSALYAYRKGVSSALSSRRGRRAMESAFLTTELGCKALLDREDSARTRRLCADRWQFWLFQFYPEYPDLAAEAQERISALGGSAVPLRGGRLLQAALPLLGWKRVRRLQVRARRWGWQHLLNAKERRRLRRMDLEAAGMARKIE